MKNIIFILVFIGCGILSAQVGIERATEPVVRGDGILDFYGDGVNTFANKGILLPKVNDTSAAGTTGGSLVFNVAAQQVQMYDTSTSSWQPLTEASTNLVGGPEHAGVANRFQESEDDSGVLIQAGTVTQQNPPDGVLVLESDDRALILPQVQDVTQFPGPKAGMICYDMASDSIAIFNGTVWSFLN